MENKEVGSCKCENMVPTTEVHLHEVIVDHKPVQKMMQKFLCENCGNSKNVEVKYMPGSPVFGRL